MTYRTFSPEALNAGRTRRDLPRQAAWPAQGREPEARDGGAMMAEMTRELDAIAAEIQRIKAARAARMPERQAPFAAAAAARPVPMGAGAGLEQMARMIDGLKDDVRAQLRNDLDGQYARLRGELEMLAKALQGTPLQGEFRREIAELSHGLDSLLSDQRTLHRAQEDLSGYLKTELSQLQRSLHGVAKAEGLTRLDATIDDRWQALETRWKSLEDRLNGVSADYGPDFRQIHDRLAALQDAAGRGGLEALENRLLMLARSVDALAHQGAAAGPALAQIDARFDELSRAIAALPPASAAPAGDDATLSQIEQALSMIAGRLDELPRGAEPAQGRALEAIERRVAALADTMAVLGQRQDNAPVLERLDRLSERFSSFQMPDISSASLDALTAQMNALAEEVRRPSANGQETLGTLGRLDRRLAAIEDRLETFATAPAAGAGFDQAALQGALQETLHETLQESLQESLQDALLDTLESRFAQLSAQIAAQQASIDAAAAQPSELDSLERRLIDISNRLAMAPAQAGDADGIARLEAQISDLSDFIAARANDAMPAADLGSAADQERIAIEAARRAADEIAARFAAMPGTDDRAAAASGLAGDLAALESLTRNNSERQARSFEAIHETLVKLVDRIAAIEARPAARPVMPAAAQLSVADTEAPAPADLAAAFEDAPSLEPDEEAVATPAAGGQPRLPRSPGQMAKAAAEAAMRNGVDEAPVAAFDVGRATADEPLDPAAGVPDLSAILKRVRDQKKATQAEVAQNARKKDYLPSIKRAAQAAAADVENVDPSKTASKRFGKAGDLYARFRRPILLAAAAAVVAIGALQLSSALLGGAPADAELPLATQAGPAPEGSQLPMQPQAALPAAPAADAGLTLPAAPGTLAAPAASDPLLAPAAPVADGAPAIQGTPAIEGTPVIQGTLPAPAGEPVAAGTPDAPRMATANAPADAAAAPADPLAAAPAVDALAAALPQGFGPAPLVAAAKAGDVKALFEIGRRLGENGADASGLTASLAWFDAAAQTGFAPAQYRVGNMHEKGLGTPTDPAAAKLWYQMAAEQGNASAMHNLAVLFANGAGGAPDAESATRWFMQAAELGVADSQYNLGILSAKGEGVPQDLEESYKWFAIVAKSGDKDAAAKRDEVAKALRPEQLENARAKAELWKPKPLVAEANDISVPDDWRISSATTASVDVRKAVTNVQLILTKLGYDTGRPDGVMGAKTRNAIRAFQQAEGLPVTGEIDAALVKALLAKNG